MLPPLFSSIEDFRAHYTARLEQLLVIDEDAGLFVLTLANIINDRQIAHRLHRVLAQRYRQLRQHAEKPGESTRLNGSPEDLKVLHQLLSIGFEGLESPRSRRAGEWELLFSPLRGLRPPRNIGLAEARLHLPFDAHGFHLARPQLEREQIWRGVLEKRECALFYNKFPFMPLHGLLVPDLHQGLPQYLRQADLATIWRITQRLGGRLPGLGFGYSAQGACSSVNHLHFQLFCRESPLPVEKPHWAHNGGATPYPTTCIPLHSLKEAESWRARLHAAETHYNLLLRPGCSYLFPRMRQGTYPLPAWSDGLAWIELAGVLTCSQRTAYEGLTQQELQQTLATASVALPAG